MSQVFGFTPDELKLLLVSVRQMRRTFAAALKNQPDAALQAYAALYDQLYEKLLDMAGPLPEGVGDLF
jgi:hypothetical protein